MIDWAHIFETFITATVPILIYLWNERRQSKKDTQKKHEENQRLLETVVQHGHEHLEFGDPKTVLTFGGIRKLNGSK